MPCRLEITEKSRAKSRVDTSREKSRKESRVEKLGWGKAEKCRVEKSTEDYQV